MLGKRVGSYGLESSGSGQGLLADSCAHGNEPWVS
jgi:hypothetical protein